ncbi:hypothetical protein [Bradyrhizobium cenepequi]|uniref:hypothetical protein n=1 Tax=Bradyrhizobium cenepequi TaxID=2821403 RepID=UPI001CE3587B|nr:hypothetical protein [Bradyrhizobium cenepequi]MCA6107975.1 hypothetical protein [Bradyrhizobium cenepequi]
MTRSRARPHSPKIEDIARKLDMVVAEVALLRMQLAANGIIAPPPSDGDYINIQLFAEINHSSPEAVLSRIRLGKPHAEQRGGRWWVKKHNLRGLAVHQPETI